MGFSEEQKVSSVTLASFIPVMIFAMACSYCMSGMLYDSARTLVPSLPWLEWWKAWILFILASFLTQRMDESVLPDDWAIQRLSNSAVRTLIAWLVWMALT